MNKGTITIELPILDDVEQMEVVNTFNEKQLWYVCAIAKAFEKSQQELQRKNEIIIDFEKWLKSIKGIEINIVKVLNKINDLKEKYNGTK